MNATISQERVPWTRQTHDLINVDIKCSYFEIRNPNVFNLISRYLLFSDLEAPSTDVISHTLTLQLREERLSFSSAETQS